MIVDIVKQDKKYKAIVPDGSDPSTWSYGVIVGPPDLSILGLPYDIEVRLHNELYVRGLIKYVDVRRDMRSVTGALMAALKVDTQLIAQAYEEMK